MAKGKHQSHVLDMGEAAAGKAVLFEVLGTKRTDQDKEGRTIHIAALSLEEIIRYIRTCHPDLDIAEVKVKGQIEVLSSSEHLG